MSHISVAVLQYGAAFTINVTVKEASQCQAKQVFTKHFFFFPPKTFLSSFIPRIKYASCVISPNV